MWDKIYWNNHNCSYWLEMRSKNMILFFCLSCLDKSCGFLRMCSGLCYFWTEVAACWIWWFIARQKAGRSSSPVLGLRGTGTMLLVPGKIRQASQAGVVSGWLKGRPSDVVAIAYVSSEIPLNSDEGTLTKSIILASSCFNREELNWEFIVSNLISLLI